MTTPDQLNVMIDELHKGNTVSPQTQEENLTIEMIELMSAFEFNPAFDERLTKQFVAQSSASLYRRQLKRGLRLVASVLIGILGVIVFISSVPALRVLAEDILKELFPRDTQTSFILNKEDDGLAFEPKDYIGFENFEIMQTIVDYDVKTIDHDETDYTFFRGVFTIPRNAIQLNYSHPSASSDYPKLRIRQQPLEDSARGTFYFTKEQDTISPEAETTPVAIGRYHGELVKGDWMTSNGQLEKMDFYWKEDAPVHRLRWQDDGFLYEIELWSADKSAVDEMISIAEMMMD